MTAFCQITGISKETKQEIVSTLEAYPIVLNELSISNELTQAQKQIISYLKQALLESESLLKNKDEEIKNLSAQKDILLKKKSSLYLYGQINLNGFDSYGIGIDYVIREVLILGNSVNYDNFNQHFSLNAKIGIKLK